MGKVTRGKRFVILICIVFVTVYLNYYFQRDINVKTSSHHGRILQVHNQPGLIVKDISMANKIIPSIDQKTSRPLSNDKINDDQRHDVLTYRNNANEATDLERSKQMKNNIYNANGGDGAKTMAYWEALTGSDPPVSDLHSLASSSKSQMSLIGQQERYFVGDIVTVNIIVNDHRRHPKKAGGDYIRIWSQGTNGTATVGKVVDNGNGSYIGKIKLLWPGDTHIKAKVVAPREHIAYIVQNIRLDNMSRKFFGEYSNGSVTELIRCTGSQIRAQQWKRSCNLTSRNNGLPWFCERPKDLVCSNWVFHKRIDLDTTDVQKQTLSWLAREPLIPSNIHILSEKRQSGKGFSTEDALSENQKVAPCQHVSPKETWHARTPVGYTRNGRWFSTFCSSSFNGTNEAIKHCLKGRRIWFLGDSTARQMFKYLFDKLSLVMTTRKWTKPNWYKLSIAADSERTFNIFFALHGLPFCFGTNKIAVKELNATHMYIDSIPAGSSDIVVIHFYLHFQFEHPEVLRMSVRKTVSSLERLIQRSPSTTIVVKGPHSFKFVPSVTMSDVWGDVVADIYREEFKNLQDHVIYLDFWDMSVATENKDLHPNDSLMEMLMNHFLSLFCP